MTRLAVFLSSAGYAGFVPFAPGTVGSIVGLGVYALLRWAHATPLAEALVIVALTAIGVWSATVAERHFGLDDPGPVVIDEVAGMLISLAFTSAGWTGALTGFVLFRLFDIVKPYPAGRFERLPGGLGIMADDVMAGIYANLALRALLWAAPGWIA
jgi:phosphatidylglycerophosphatase A